MKSRTKLIACGTSALFAAVLCLQAQSTQTPPSSPPPPIPPDNVDPLTPTPDPNNPSNIDRRSTTPSSSGPNASSSDNSLRGATSEYSAQSANSMQANVTGTASAQTETQVTTIVQQIDQQGPAIVERAVTRFAPVACTEDNARRLIEALHNGSEVTLTSDKGESATFTPTTRLGYGEAYIALSLAAEALRQNGITGCATPEQWRSVLLGGPLTGATSTSAVSSSSSMASSTSSFPGILVLRQQGQGWGQIAQTTNVQLGTVVSSAQSSLNLTTNSRSGLSSSTGEMDQSKPATDTQTQSTDDKTDKSKKKHWWQRDHSKDDKTNPDKKDSEPDKEDPNKS